MRSSTLLLALYGIASIHARPQSTDSPDDDDDTPRLQPQDPHSHRGHHHLHRRADPISPVTVTVTALAPPTCATGAQTPFVQTPFIPGSSQPGRGAVLPPAPFSGSRIPTNADGTVLLSDPGHGTAPIFQGGQAAASSPPADLPPPPASSSTVSPAQDKGFVTQGLTQGQIAYNGQAPNGGAGSRPPLPASQGLGTKSSGSPDDSEGSLANPTAAAIAPDAPMATLVPGLHPSHEGDDIEHLRPSADKTVFYAERNPAATAEMAKFATLALTSTFDLVALEHSTYLTYTFAAGLITISFNDMDAYNFVKTTWTPVAGNLLFVTAHDVGGGVADDRAFWTVSGLSFSDSGMSAKAAVIEVTIQDAAHTAEVKWGSYIPIDVDLDGAAAASSSSTASSSGSNPTGSLFDGPFAASRSASRSTTTTSSSLSGPPAPTGSFYNSTANSTLSSSSSDVGSKVSNYTGSMVGSSSTASGSISDTLSTTSTQPSVNGFNSTATSTPSLSEGGSCQGTSPTVSGYPAVACGPTFDRDLDDRIGYYTEDEATQFLLPGDTSLRFRRRARKGVVASTKKATTKASKQKPLTSSKLRKALKAIAKPLAKALKAVKTLVKLLSPTPTFDKTLSLSLGPPNQKKSPFAGTKKVSHQSIMPRPRVILYDTDCYLSSTGIPHLSRLIHGGQEEHDWEVQG